MTLPDSISVTAKGGFLSTSKVILSEQPCGTFIPILKRWAEAHRGWNAQSICVAKIFANGLFSDEINDWASPVHALAQEVIAEGPVNILSLTWLGSIRFPQRPANPEDH